MDKMTVEDLRRIMANPFYAINIHESMTANHDPMISEADWIKANMKTIEEIGAHDTLWLILENLKGNFVSSPKNENVVDGYKTN